VNAKPEQRAQAAALLRASPGLSDREVARRVGLGNKTVSRLRGQLGIARDLGEHPDRQLSERGAAERRDAEFGAVAGLPAVELAVAAGASERKLRRWQAEGLLPEPARYWVGKRRVSLYAARDVDRVRAVAELMARYHNVDRVALGLHALGYAPSEERLRGAYDRFLARQEEWFTPLDAAFNALRNANWWEQGTPELDEVVAWVETLVRSPGLAWARTRASLHESEDLPLPDATWEYLENATSIHVRGSLGSDESAEHLLNAFAARMPPGAASLMNERPIAEQVAAWGALQRGSRISTLRRIAAEAPLEELAQACDEVVSVVVGYLVMMDAAPYIGGDEPACEPPLLCEVLNIDPSALAYFGLLAASFKRDPEIGDELGQWLASFRELTDYFVRVVLAKINGRVPALEAVALRYLDNRVGRATLRPNSANGPR
jgi:DNA-binding transcriptional MerR regulator